MSAAPPSSSPPRVGVVGHTELVDFAVVERLPRAGEIVAATEPPFTVAGGGGGIAAVELARLAGTATLLTSVGDDAAGERVVAGLRAAGVEVHAAVHPLPQRRAIAFLDAAGERTITVLGARHVPLGADPLPWDALAGFDALFFAGGDAAALRAARAARHLVATPRALDALATAGVEVDVLVASAADAEERAAAETLAAADPHRPPPRVIALTEGAAGGRWTAADGTTGRWAPTALPAPPVDTFGCGDAFAAGLTYGLGASLGLEQALDLAARSGARTLTHRGPYRGLTP